MSEFSDDIARGCLKNGEPLEARWGTGEWSNLPENSQEPEWGGEPCPNCGNMLHTYGGFFEEDCEKCGWKRSQITQ